MTSILDQQLDTPATSLDIMSYALTEAPMSVPHTSPEFADMYPLASEESLTLPEGHNERMLELQDQLESMIGRKLADRLTAADLA